MGESKRLTIKLRHVVFMAITVILALVGYGLLVENLFLGIVGGSLIFYLWALIGFALDFKWAGVLHERIGDFLERIYGLIKKYW